MKRYWHRTERRYVNESEAVELVLAGTHIVFETICNWKDCQCGGGVVPTIDRA